MKPKLVISSFGRFDSSQSQKDLSGIQVRDVFNMNFSEFEKILRVYLSRHQNLKFEYSLPLSMGRNVFKRTMTILAGETIITSIEFFSNQNPRAH